MLKIKFFSLLILLVLFSGLHGQSDASLVEAEVTATFAVKLGKTAPVHTLTPMKGADLEKKSAYKKRYKGRTIPNFLGRDVKANAWKDALPQGADPVHQGAIKSAGSVEVIPTVNVNGMQTGAAGNPSPPDPEPPV